MKKNLLILIATALSFVSGSLFADSSQLTPLTSFGSNGNGSILPGERSYITGNGTNLYQRGMAFNPSTGHLIVANRSPVTAPTLNLVDGTTGADAGSMAFEPQVLGGNVSFYLNKVGVADDGAVYVANLSSASTATIQYVLYRYASETDAQTLVFAGDPSNGAATSSQSNGRWGDTMAVRGSGTNTQILIASQGNLFAILTPTDETMSTFTAKTFTTTAASGALSDSLSFGAGDTFWGKAGGGTLRRISFDYSAGTSTLLQTYPTTGFPTRIGPVLNITSSNLLAGIEVVPGADFVKLYDVTDVSTNPVFLDRETFTTNLNNGVYGGSVCFGAGNLYTLDSDNGIQAFTVVSSNELVTPTFYLNPVGGVYLIGSNITFTAAADGIPAPTYQWYFNQTNAIAGATTGTLSLTNLQVSDAGLYSIVASNSVGTVTSTVVTLSVVPSSLLYLYEPFNYTAGAQVTDFSLGPNQQWTLNGSTTNDNRIASANLAIPGLAASIGNSFTNGGTGAAARIPMGLAQNSGSVYASFAFKIDSIGTSFTGTGLLASFVDNSPNDQVGRFVMTKNGAGYSLGIGKATTSGVFATNIFAEGEIVFVVLRYTFVSGSTTNDQASLWLNPDPSTFGGSSAPAPTVSALIAGTDAAQVDMFALRQNSSANTPAILNYDELRIANNWAQVTPTATVAFSLKIQSNTNGIVISWPTSGSTGFNLEGASALGNPANWSTVAEAVVVEGTNNTVTLGAGGTQFFRLKK